jgi:hypothetical protein
MGILGRILKKLLPPMLIVAHAAVILIVHYDEISMESLLNGVMDVLMADRQRRCFRLSMVICECMCWADRPELVYNETSDNKLGPFDILTEPKLDCRAQTRVVEVSFSIVMTKTAKRNWRSECQSCVHDGRLAPESKLQRCPKM